MSACVESWGTPQPPAHERGTCQVRFLHSLARRRRDEEQGFTLIELMVVVLIIAILIAIAIPTFLGARNRAQDRAAQSSLRNALTAAKTSFTDTSDYSGGDRRPILQAIEPSLNVRGTAASTGFKVVSVRHACGGGDDLVGEVLVEVGHVLRYRGQVRCRWWHRSTPGRRRRLRRRVRHRLPAPTGWRTPAGNRIL